MNIQSTLKVSRIKAPISSSLQKLAAEKNHDVAWAHDSNDFMAQFRPVAGSSLINPSKLYTESLHKLGEKESSTAQKKRNVAFASLVLTGTTLVKEHFPEAEGAVDGMELMVASAQAFETWSDPEQVGVVQPTLKTAKVIVEALDILAPIIPQLQVLTPHLKTISLVLKFGDFAYQVYQEPTATT